MSKNVNSLINRNDGIDCLRGFSILSVILLHCYVHMPFVQTLVPQKIINIIFRSGYYGVMIFFVISGFLITTISLARWKNLSNIEFSQFYKIRFARIFPCLCALLIVLSLLNLFGVPGFVIKTTSLPQALFSAFTFQINWLEAKTGYLPANWDVLWSLSVEEMFYLFFPLVCFIFKKPSYFIIPMLFFIVLGPFARTTFTENDIWSDHSYLSCMDGIAIGCLAGMFSYYFKLSKKMLIPTFLVGLFLSTFIFIFRSQAYDIGITTIGLNVTMLEIGIGLLLIVMHEWYVKDNHRGSIWTSPLRWIGYNSYEIYLTHSFVIVIIAKNFFSNTQSSFHTIMLYVTTLILSGVFGKIVSTYFSEPLNKLIKNTKPHKNKILQELA